MSFLRRSCQYTSVMLVIIYCMPAEAQQKVSLSSLTGNGFEIKGTISFTGVTMILVQKDKDVFVCDIFQSKDSSYNSTCFPVR
jgi:hypothetical protein